MRIRNTRGAALAGVLFAATLLVSSTLTALGYTNVGPYLDDTWGTLYTHQPRVCDGGNFWDGSQYVNVSACYDFYVEDTPSQNKLVTTFIRWGSVNPAIIFGPTLYWGPTWVVDNQNGSNTTQYVDFLCNYFTSGQMSPYYYKQASGGTYSLPSSVQQYVWGDCPPGGFGIAMYEELMTYTH